MTFVLDWGNFFLWAATIGLLAWAIQYQVLEKWWKNPLGVTFMGLEVLLFLVYLPSVVEAVDPRFAFVHATWYQIYATVIVTLTAIFIYTRIAWYELIRRIRRKNGYSKKADKE